MPLIEAVTRPAHLTARAQPHAPRAWYEIRNAADADEAELLIYDEIGGWFGNTPGEIVDELRAVTAPNLRVRINSPGGSVFDGIAIANAIRLHPANVTVQVDGIAASAASVIAMAGDRIVMTPQSQLMIHDASGMCFGNAADMTEMATLLDTQSDNIADAYAERAGGTREEWRERMRAESWYLAAEAVSAGLADEVLPSRKATEEPEPALTNSWDLSVFRYAGRDEAPAPATGGLVTASLAVVGEGPVCDGAVPPARPVPGPPPARVELQGEHDPETLTFAAGSVLTADMVALLHAATAPAEPETPTVDNQTITEPESAEDPAAETTPDSAVAPAAAADEPAWAATVAHLMTPPPSADDEFTRLKEALL
ncbi:head maturation protease, ClpP-related [Streptomyces sp. QL37]|uniref:head maturation protease, ClpP-related n=1 Tax=Streptomyces sp. QL37 TaxID=2093747 RepID=UPI000CF26437|nr:head maturation protease, ClpP-related [Streptomyces sp. QL37]PPQ57139.1 peptidase S14 [Streptomyces sp. QL37]